MLRREREATLFRRSWQGVGAWSLTLIAACTCVTCVCRRSRTFQLSYVQRRYIGGKSTSNVTAHARERAKGSKRVIFLLTPASSFVQRLPLRDALQSKTLRYIGVSRGIQQSLRLCLARCPSETHYFKVITRAFLQRLALRASAAVGPQLRRLCFRRGTARQRGSWLILTRVPPCFFAKCLWRTGMRRVETLLLIQVTQCCARVS